MTKMSKLKPPDVILNSECKLAYAHSKYIQNSTTVNSAKSSRKIVWTVMSGKTIGRVDISVGISKSGSGMRGGRPRD